MARRTFGTGHDLRRPCIAGSAQATAARCLLIAIVASAATADVTLTLGPDTVDTYTGRVYLAAAQGRLEPRGGDWWFDPNPLFFVDVNNWTPGTPQTLPQHLGIEIQFWLHHYLDQKLCLVYIQLVNYLKY